MGEETPKLLSKKATKEAVKALGLRMSSDVAEALNSLILNDILTKAAKRTKANGRKTLRVEDL